jgi:hypothetical protein
MPVERAAFPSHNVTRAVRLQDVIVATEPILTDDMNLMNVADPAVPFRRIAGELRAADVMKASATGRANADHCCRRA